jgi:thiol-disulfide isomerase/thioredoxin
MRRALWIIGALALAAVLAVGVVQAGGDGGPDDGGPAFDLADAQRTLRGAPGPLAALYARANTIEPADVTAYERTLRGLRGHPVVVNAWASWCGPCKLEFPIFQRVATRLGTKVAFLGLNVNDNRGEAEEYLAEMPLPYPSLEDGDSRIVQRAAASAGLPTTIFYDAEGNRTGVHQGGYRTEQDLIDDIERYAGA